MLISEKNLIVSLSYNKVCFKTKIKSYGDEVTDFYNKKIPKLNSNYAFLVVIILDSPLKKDDSCVFKRA